MYLHIGFGVQSIKHANVLSEKINFSALGGSKVAIFGGDDLDPIYFEVHMTRFKNEVRSYCKSQTNLKVVKWG